jgi:hypothetical protein
VDVDEVDRWLDAADLGGGGAAAADPPDRSAGRRMPWRWIGAAALLVWLAAAAVAVLDGEEGAAEAVPATAAPGMIGAAPTPTGPATSGPTTSPATEAPQPSEPPTAAADGVAATIPPRLEAGAVRALRTHLTVAGPPARYLEWATPTGAALLEGGVWLVEVEAVWLTGEAALDVAHLGRWAVPLAEDGRALAAPWPLAGSPAAPVDSDPPTGTTRLPEVAQGLRDAGWAEVTAVAADPHPLVTDVVVALVEGTPPGGAPPGPAVVWLVEDADGRLAPLEVGR